MELLTNFSIEAAVQIALQELENDPSTQFSARAEFNTQVSN